MKIPAHKVVGDFGKPGQHVFSPPVPNTGFDREPYLKHSAAEPQQEQYLSQYIAKKDDTPKRITFAEWSKERHGYDLTQHYFVMDSADMLECWNAALKQGKL